MRVGHDTLEISLEGMRDELTTAAATLVPFEVPRRDTLLAAILIAEAALSSELHPELDHPKGAREPTQRTVGAYSTLRREHGIQVGCAVFT